MKGIQAKIDKAVGAALMAAAKHLNNETIPLTPVYKGDLQQAKRVEQVSDTEVYCISGGVALGSGVNVDKYLKAQYYGANRHLGSQMHMESLRGQPAPASQTKTGEKEPYMYNAKYYAAKKSGLMKQMDAPRWYERALADKAIMRRVHAVFKNQFTAAMK